VVSRSLGFLLGGQAITVELAAAQESRRIGTFDRGKRSEEQKLDREAGFPVPFSLPFIVFADHPPPSTPLRYVFLLALEKELDDYRNS
jgi:hypothetical protein